jgi:hypothetical protein
VAGKKIEEGKIGILSLEDLNIEFPDVLSNKDISFCKLEKCKIKTPRGSTGRSSDSSEE